MKIDIVTIFPKQVQNFVSEGIFKRAKDLVQVEAHDLRKFTTDTHKTVDDKPFGGGPGMILKVEPIYKMVQSLRKKGSWVILTGPRGKKLTPQVAKRLAEKSHVIIVCGHYEGVDDRVREKLADEEISIGDYVLSGGELPALVIADALLRHIPGVVGNPDSLVEESFEPDVPLEYPQYTRPANFKGWKVPEVLLSGNHEEVRKWRKTFVNKKNPGVA